MARIIKIVEGIKNEIAQRVVEQSHPGYTIDALGAWYVVDGECVMHAQQNRPWDPWHDDADVIGVEDLVNIFGGAERDLAEFDPTPVDGSSDEVGFEMAVEFALEYVPDQYDAEAYEARHG